MYGNYNIVEICIYPNIFVTLLTMVSQICRVSPTNDLTLPFPATKTQNRKISIRRPRQTNSLSLSFSPSRASRQCLSNMARGATPGIKLARVSANENSTTRPRTRAEVLRKFLMRAARAGRREWVMEGNRYT